MSKVTLNKYEGIHTPLDTQLCTHQHIGCTEKDQITVESVSGYAAGLSTVQF